MTNDTIFKIPEYIKKLPKLNFTDQVILSQIDFADQGEGCKKSNNQLAKYVAKTGRTVQNIVLKLEQLGYITRDIICRYQRKLKCTFEKLSKPIEKAKEVIEGGTKLLRTGTKFVRDIFNSKQSKSYNNQEVKGYQKIPLKIYQGSFTTIQEFESYCIEQEKRDDVIVDRIYCKLDKVSLNSSLNIKEVMKLAYNNCKLKLTANV
jgi:hypothetical protein